MRKDNSCRIRRARHTEAASKGVFGISRSGNEALRTRVLPEGVVRTIEIAQNNSNVAQGCGRVGAARVDAIVFHDQVPDEQIHWYWIKITRPNDVIGKLGPASTPDCKVWQPAG